MKGRRHIDVNPYKKSAPTAQGARKYGAAALKPLKGSGLLQSHAKELGKQGIKAGANAASKGW
jgi:hypothetical protein